MVCVVTVITISVFTISPILNIQLHSQDSCKCNCPFFLKNIIFDIVIPFKSLWLFEKVLHKTQNPFFLLERACFLNLLVQGVYSVNFVCTGNLCKTVYIPIMYRGGWYFELLVLLSMLLVEKYTYLRIRL